MSSSGIQPIQCVSISAIDTPATIHQITVVGWQFVGRASPSKLLGNVSLLPEPTNPVDQGAVLVIEDGEKVGYVLRKSIAPVHFLLANFLGKLRDEEGLHSDEMVGPLLVNLVQAGDDGRVHGSLKVVGIDHHGKSEELPISVVPIHKVERFLDWQVELVVAGNPVVHRRHIKYDNPVSKRLVDHYCAASYSGMEVQSVTPLP